MPLLKQTYINAASYSQFGVTQNVYAVYVEGIYVGYRYYETRYADVVMGSANVGDYNYDKDVAFPFGHGLSGNSSSLRRTVASD